MLQSELAQLFNENLFIPDMKAETKEEALTELLELFVQEKIVKNKQIVMEMLRQRETLGSTGIGNGIAIPHGRTTAATDVFIAFGKAQKGMDFDAIDKKPVNLFFMIIAPPLDEENKYLPALGSLVTLLKDDASRKKFAGVESFTDFISIISGE